MKYILEYQKFLNRSSKTGMTKQYDIVDKNEPDIKSRGHLIMLQNMYRELEIDDEIEKTLTGSDNDSNISRKARELAIAINNNRFILKKLEEDGILKCEYCDRNDLKYYSIRIKNGRLFSEFKKSDGATADHKVPISKGGDKYNFDNLAVCCYRCNQLKDNKSWEDWNTYLNNK